MKKLLFVLMTSLIMSITGAIPALADHRYSYDSVFIPDVLTLAMDACQWSRNDWGFPKYSDYQSAMGRHYHETNYLDYALKSAYNVWRINAAHTHTKKKGTFTLNSSHTFKNHGVNTYRYSSGTFTVY